MSSKVMTAGVITKDGQNLRLTRWGDDIWIHVYEDVNDPAVTPDGDPERFFDGYRITGKDAEELGTLLLLAAAHEAAG